MKLHDHFVGRRPYWDRASRIASVLNALPSDSEGYTLLSGELESIVKQHLYTDDASKNRARFGDLPLKKRVILLILLSVLVIVLGALAAMLYGLGQFVLVLTAQLVETFGVPGTILSWAAIIALLLFATAFSYFLVNWLEEVIRCLLEMGIRYSLEKGISIITSWIMERFSGKNVRNEADK